MTLVLDTSILIDLENRNETTIKKIQELSLIYPAPAKITFINQFEFIFGTKERNPINKEKALGFVNKFTVINTTNKSATIISDIKHNYGKKGETINLADLLISSLVIENNFILVTKDKGFDKIQEMKKIII